MTPLLRTCAVVITLETQKCRKRALRFVEFNFFLIAIDRNGFPRMKDEGKSTNSASDVLIFALGLTVRSDVEERVAEERLA